MGFNDTELPLKTQALARRIVEGFEAPLAEDGLVRVRKIDETSTLDPIERAEGAAS